jgi:predicted phosphodiesterase
MRARRLAVFVAVGLAGACSKPPVAVEPDLAARAADMNDAEPPAAAVSARETQRIATREIVPDAQPDTQDTAGAPGEPDAPVAAPQDPSPTNPLRFVVLADPQVGMTPTDDGSDLDMKFFALAVQKIGALQPPAAFALDCGDLVHNATGQSWQNYLTVAARMPIPHHEVMGNHDGWSAQGLAYFRTTLGKQDQFALVDGEVLFVALNSMFLKHPGAMPGETQSQKAFLAETLAKHASAKQKFLFFHYPLFTQAPGEPEDDWNLPLPERQYLIEVIESAGITGVFSGHLHRTVIVQHKGKLLLTSGPIAQPLGLNSDGNPAGRGFFVFDLDRVTGKLTYKWQPLSASEL